MFVRKMTGLLFAGALAVGLSTVTAGSAQASVTPDPAWNEIFAPYLTAKANTLCVDAPGGTTAPGAHLQLFHCHGYGSDGAPQRWQFHFVGSDGWPLYEIRNVHSGLCATLTSTGITQDTCSSSFVYWELRSENLWSADPNVELGIWNSSVSGPGSYCITAGNSSDSDHTPLVATQCDAPFANGRQVWNL
jgi:Ricin-type beta-trefoil lectin domain